MKNFGPHNLLCRLLEARGLDPGRVQSVPKKGSGNIKRELEMNGPRLTKMGPVIAVLDRDKLDKLLNLPKGSCRTEQLRHLAKWSESVSYLLLEDNMESLIAVCAQVLGDPTSLEKPSPVERDRLVNKVAWSRELSLQVAQEYSPLARILQVLERQWPRQT